MFGSLMMLASGVVASLAQFGQVVGDLLIGAQGFREAGKNAARQRDVSRFNVDIRGGSEGFDDRKKRVGGECWSFVGKGVDDLRTVGHFV